MNNIKLGVKFAVLLFILIAVVVCQIVYMQYSTNKINNEMKSALYDEIYVSTTDILNADRDFYQANVAESELAFSEPDAARKKQLIDDYNENVGQVRSRINDAMANLEHDDYMYNQFKGDVGSSLSQLNEQFMLSLDKWEKSYDVVNKTGDYGQRQKLFSESREYINSMTELLEQYANYYSDEMQTSISHSNLVSCIVFSGLSFVSVMLVLIMVGYVIGSLKYLEKINKKIAGGCFDVTVEKKRMSKDEVGNLCASTEEILAHLNNYKNYISEISNVLDSMANGQLRIDLSYDYAGEFAQLKTALYTISSSLNRTITSISEIARQVNIGAEEVSNSSQSLAQGATEQAGTIEQLAETISRISEHINTDAQNADHAKQIVASTKMETVTGNEQMKKMISAVTQISNDSAEIAKILKIIDDIAFQTKILALNASVEAARAGEAGKGFAVVADEVRNLAAKSAQAAHNTAELIEQSISRVNEGASIARDTAKSFNEIASGIGEASSIMDEIAESTKDQSQAIQEVNLGIEQISSVIQTNSATAEENAAASEELSGQSEMLRDSVSVFKIYSETNIRDESTEE